MTGADRAPCWDAPPSAPASARHAPPAVDEEHHWFHDLLVRVHLAHAPIH